MEARKLAVLIRSGARSILVGRRPNLHKLKGVVVMKTFLALSLLASTLLCLPNDARLGKSSREEKGGWISLHLEGKPADVGYQQGYLLATEIDDAIKMFGQFLKGSTKEDWSFYRNAAERMFWPKLEKEYQDEIRGIAEGLNAKGFKYDRIDITALNGWMELAQYYLPVLMDRQKRGSGNNKAPGNCSAFIATGSYTDDGKIVMAHNAWVEYVVGERWNIVADIVPEHGHRMMMDIFPGFIDSGDDFVINDAGILYTETTISQFKGFDENGTPEFMRARKAAQYANSIDDFVAIMTSNNNGAYANTWLIGDTKTNEIAKLDLGLKHHHLWRTKDGVYVGSNFATDKELLADETTFDVSDKSSSPNARKIRWEQLVEQNKGKVNPDLARLFEGDHIDANLGTAANNRCVICGHIDEDPLGSAVWDWPPYYPGGSVQAKVTSASLAKDLQFWARMGHPCGADFIAATFLEKHPEFKWMSPYLRDMKAGPWTMFEAKR